MRGNVVEISFQAKFLRKATKSQEFRRNSFALLLHNTVRPGRCVDPMEDIAVVDGTLLHMEISNDPIPMSSPESGVNFKGFGFGESPAPFEVHIPSLFSSVDDFDPTTDAAAFPLPDVVMIGDERYEIEISC